MSTPRVALFCETYNEINGVALTARQLVAYAKRRQLPLLAVHGGKTPGAHDEGSVRRIEMKRGWVALGIERDLEVDLLFFWKYRELLRGEVEKFQPDVIHIISPGELGVLGVYLSRKMNIPLVASWHTNYHQFAARRLHKALGFAPKSVKEPIVKWSEERGLRLLLWFYGYAKVTLAPTVEQVEWLERELNRPSFLMPRGVDAEQFNPKHRTVNDRTLRLGFVGRITPEKSVRLFLEIERALELAGFENFQIVMVGAGSEVDWLKRRLKHGEFTGVLRGEDLARAYANMDLFVFPSKTDTFGNVVQEAAASEVPAVVTNEGGPQALVVAGTTGYVAATNEELIERVVELVRDTELRKRMGKAARERVAGASWDMAFEKTYLAYRACLPEGAEDGTGRKRAAVG
jgi:glycosyltransferase involved in cell wall biosynthesis